ncbi:MAG: DUF4494 domain-containing protein [Muribaculaceae bacterium]
MMSTYFEIGIRYEKTLENGIKKKVTELFIVDALSFTEAEARIIEEMQPFITGEFMVSTIKRANINGIVIDEMGVTSAGDAEAQKILNANSKATGYADKWYKAKLNFIVLDEKSAREKKIAYYLLVNAGSVNAAHDVIVKHMKGSMQDYEIANIDETNIFDVFFYENTTLQTKKEKRDTAKNLMESLFNDDGIQRHVKDFKDAVPLGMKVSIKTATTPETIIVDKSDGHEL